MRHHIVTTLVVCIWTLSSAQGTKGQPPLFSALPKGRVLELQRQRAVVAATIKQRYPGSSLVGTKADLPILQKLIDDSVFKKSQTYELQCVGVAFGDVLASEFPLKWVMVTDEFGTDVTLRYKRQNLHVNALTMISKRVESGKRVSLAELLKITRQQLTNFEKSQVSTRKKP